MALSALAFLDSSDKAKWSSLKGALKHSKASLTRKLQEEVETSEKLAPTVTSGPEAGVQLIKYNSYHNLFLLQSFGAASDAILSFLRGIEGQQDDFANKVKIPE